MEECHFLIVTLQHGCFTCFLNCTNGTKSRKASYIKNLASNAILSVFKNKTITSKIIKSLREVKENASYFKIIIK